jgi:hypothetical protein
MMPAQTSPTSTSGSVISVRPAQPDDEPALKAIATRAFDAFDR